MKCGTTETARNVLSNGFRYKPTDIVLHTGTNDIESTDATSDPKATAVNIMNNAAEAAMQYQCSVYVSQLPPRSDSPLSAAAANTNKWIDTLKKTDSKYAEVNVIAHHALTIDHLWDKKHLDRYGKH